MTEQTELRAENLVTRAGLIRLLESPQAPCVSLFVPTDRKYGEKARQSRIWLKNLIVKADEALEARELRSTERRSLLSPASRLIDEGSFWEEQSDGLAMFLSPSGTKLHRVPLDLEPRAVVGPRFHIKPLLPLLRGNMRFFVLALSQNDVKLYECTRDTMTEVDLGATPRSLAEALKFDDPEKQLQYHTGTSQAGASGGRRSAVFHGQGSSKDASDDALERYLRAVDKGLFRTVLRDETAPLVLAGVDHVLSSYRDVTSYSHVLESHVSGNPEQTSDQRLLSAAWDLVEPITRKEIETAARTFGAAEHRSTDVQKIVEAAHGGRVDLLLLDPEHDLWGEFDADSGKARSRSQEPRNTDEDLLNLAAALTLSRGGTVHALEAEEIPGNGPAAAVFRY